MIVRKEGLSGETRRASLHRRLNAVADIRRREFMQTPLLHRRQDLPRFASMERAPHSQDAA